MLVFVFILSLIARFSCVPLIVNTDKGPILGFYSNSVATFTGIPYAQPPIGDLRWRAPIEPMPWTNTINTTKFSASCVQDHSDGYTFPPDIVFNENCLYLNVWAPNTTGTKAVFVWIHGGGLEQGGNSELRLRGENMAIAGNIIVVNINYRLGILGWLAHSAFAQDDPSHPAIGNYGFLDQQLALKWVKKNIALFGGNPAQVTIGGESAGGSSMCFHLVSPSSKGLYSQVIVESSACFDEIHSLTNGQSMAIQFQKAMSCNGDSIEIKKCLRNLGPEKILAYPNHNSYGVAVINGHEFVEHPYSSIVNKRINPVTAVIAGNVRNEGTLFVGGLPRPLSESAYKAVMYKQYSNNAALMLQYYPCGNYNASDCWYAAAEAFGDFLLVCPTKVLTDALAGTVPTFAYEFSHAPLWGNRSTPGFGAFHSSEIAFVFSTLQTIYPFDPTEIVLSKQITAFWTNFTKTSNPGNDWPRYTGLKGTRFVFMTGGTPPVTGYKDIECGEVDSNIYKVLYNY